MRDESFPSLRDWYERQIADATSVTGKITGGFAVLSVVYFGFPALWLVKNLWDFVVAFREARSAQLVAHRIGPEMVGNLTMHAEDAGIELGIYGLVILPRCFVFFLVIALVVWGNRRNSPATLLRSGKIRDITSHTHLPLRRLIDDLAVRASVPPEALCVLAQTTGKMGASVLEKKGRVYLLVTAGLMVLGRREPNTARVILAHELGHVVQSDSRLWTYSKMISRFLFVGVLPFELLSIAFLTLFIVASLWLAGPSGDNDVVRVQLWGMTATRLVFLAFSALLTAYSVRSRRRSEFLADAYAVLMVGWDTTEDVLRRSLASLRSGERKDVVRRLARLRALRTRFGDAH